jgi:small nuclear ribonucleoprotein (snRNP)-like protein
MDSLELHTERLNDLTGVKVYVKTSDYRMFVGTLQSTVRKRDKHVVLVEAQEIGEAVKPMIRIPKGKVIDYGRAWADIRPEKVFFPHR